MIFWASLITTILLLPKSSFSLGEEYSDNRASISGSSLFRNKAGKYGFTTTDIKRVVLHFGNGAFDSASQAATFWLGFSQTAALYLR